MLPPVVRSHVCIACGQDLAQLRAPPDAHYGLPVVVCPVCAQACVRRPYGGMARWRSTVRLWRTSMGLVIRLVLLALFTIATVFFSGSIGAGLQSVLGRAPIITLLSMDARQQARLMHWYEYEGIWMVPIWLIVSVCVGVVIGLAFPHWRARWWPIGVGAVVFIPLWAAVFLLTAETWAEGNFSLLQAWQESQPGWDELRWILWPLGVAAVLSWGMIPIGQRAARARFSQKGLRSRRLKKARKRRNRV